MATATGHLTPPIRWRGMVRLAVAVGVLAVLAARFGPAPFARAFASLSASTVLAAVALAAVYTVCCAMRWCLVAEGLGAPVRRRDAVPAYYRSQLLNVTLPGGILGDVHRGVSANRDGAPLGRSLRAVAWERVLGQLVQIALTVAVLTLSPSPLRHDLVDRHDWGLVAAIVAVAVALATFAVRRRLRGTHTIAADWRGIIAVPHAAVLIGVLSAVAVCAHVGMFLLAAYSIDSRAGLRVLIPIALAVLLIGALPVNIAGWGPREGAAAWTFALCGLGPAEGLSTSVLYGVLALIGMLPGVAVLLRVHPGGRRERL